MIYLRYQCSIAILVHAVHQPKSKLKASWKALFFCKIFAVNLTSLNLFCLAENSSSIHVHSKLWRLVSIELALNVLFLLYVMLFHSSGWINKSPELKLPWNVGWCPGSKDVQTT